MKRAIAIFMSLAIILSLCPAVISSAEAGTGSQKIDLSGYLPVVEEGSSLSGVTQSVVTASASHEADNCGVATLIDNSTTSRYIGIGNSTEFAPTWVQLDLQKVYTIDKVGINTFSWNGMGAPKDFTIEVSMTGAENSWTTVYTKTGLAIEEVVSTCYFEFPFMQDVNARYVRLNVTELIANADTGAHLSLNEISVFGVDHTVAPGGPTLGDKLTIDAGKVTASGEYGGDWTIGNLFDGKLDTHYAAISQDKAPGTRMNEWVQMDLQEKHTLTKIRLANRSDERSLSGLPSVFDVLISDDGENWTKIQSVNGISEEDIIESRWLEVTFDPVETRYIRVHAFDIAEIGEASLGYCMTLREFEAWTAEGKLDFSHLVPNVNGDALNNTQEGGWGSNVPQNIVSASKSYEQWGWGLAGLIDGKQGPTCIFACAPNSDAEVPVVGMKDVIDIDLENAYFLDGLRMASILENSLGGVPSAFKVQVSLDGARWVTVLNQKSVDSDMVDEDGRYYTFHFGPTDPVRFVRITITGVGDAANAQLGYTTALSELEFYGKLDPDTVIKPEGWGKIDLSKAIVRATNSYSMWGHGVGNLYNGDNTSNFFAAVSVDDGDYYFSFHETETFPNECDEFLKIKLDGVYNIDLMQFQSVWAASGRGVPNKYRLEVSMDGKTWTTALDVDGQEVSETDMYGVNFDTVQARYLRLRFFNVIEPGDLGYVPHLKELEFYGVQVSKDTVENLDEVPAPKPPVLEPLPGDEPSKTGDESFVLLSTALLSVALLGLVAVTIKRRKLEA